MKAQQFGLFEPHKVALVIKEPVLRIVRADLRLPRPKVRFQGETALAPSR